MTDEDLNSATDILNSFLFVGNTDEWDRSICLFNVMYVGSGETDAHTVIKFPPQSGCAISTMESIRKLRHSSLIVTLVLFPPW